MKMSDVWPSGFTGVDFTYGFYESAVTDTGEEFAGSDEYPLCGLLFTNEEPAKAAMHAINNHDSLVEALEFCLSEMDSYDFAIDDVAMEVGEKVKQLREVLEKAKCDK